MALVYSNREWASPHDGCGAIQRPNTRQTTVIWVQLLSCEKFWKKKCIKGFSFYLTGTWPFSPNQHGFLARCFCLSKPSGKASTKRCSHFVRVVKCWNKLSASIAMSPSVLASKSQLSHHHKISAHPVMNTCQSLSCFSILPSTDDARDLFLCKMQF